MADEAKRRAERYQKYLPLDYEKARRLLQSYSGIPEAEVEDHLRTVREEAWNVFPYGCIGRWRFLDLYITTLPIYPNTAKRTQAGDTFLDAGCAFGYVLRQLSFGGAPEAHLIGADLRQEFIDLGYELFKDRDMFEGRFVTGNMLELSDPALATLDGKADIIHAASIFHLFGYDDQIKLGERLVRFFKPDAREAMLIGRQVGNWNPLDRASHDEHGLGRYHHSPGTLQGLWDVIGERTGTRWKVDAKLEEEDRGSNAKRVTIKFVVRKVD